MLLLLLFDYLVSFRSVKPFQASVSTSLNGAEWRCLLAGMVKTPLSCHHHQQRPSCVASFFCVHRHLIWFWKSDKWSHLQLTRIYAGNSHRSCPNPLYGHHHNKHIFFSIHHCIRESKWILRQRIGKRANANNALSGYLFFLSSTL